MKPGKSKIDKQTTEEDKLERSKKSQVRMIASSAARFKFKYGKTEDPNQISKDTNSRNIRMYETHYPGFCYLRNGEYRKKTSNLSSISNPDPIQCSQRIKTILFTNSELDIYKTMCLHLLGTQIESRHHIQRKDGRLCSYVKAQSMGNTPHTLQPLSQKIGILNSNNPMTKYDKILPRYILDVKVLNPNISMSSVKAYDYDSGSEEESKRKRKIQVPIYINNEIRMIINSVMEALEAVESSKLNALIELASSPEELRNMLTNEGLQDYIIELAEDPLTMKPTSYDYVMAHLMFDKIPEKGTLETVAQVLEVYDASELKTSLNQIRKGILQRHLELVRPHIIQQKRMGIQDRSPPLQKVSKMSNLSYSSYLKYLVTPGPAMPIPAHTTTKETTKQQSDIKVEPDLENETKKRKNSNIGVRIESTLSFDEHSLDREKNSLTEENRESFHRSYRIDSDSSNRSEIQRLSNPQRILLGLKVASLKSKPVNMHQFDGKKKIDIASIINPIIHSSDSYMDTRFSSIDNNIQFSSHYEKEQWPARKKGIYLPFEALNLNAMEFNVRFEKKVKRSGSSKMSSVDTPTPKLENLNRALLANLRLDISETENKKRVVQFMSTI